MKPYDGTWQETAGERKVKAYRTLKSAILISATEWSNGLVVQSHDSRFGFDPACERSRVQFPAEPFFVFSFSIFRRQINRDLNVHFNFFNLLIKIKKRCLNDQVVGGLRSYICLNFEQHHTFSTLLICTYSLLTRWKMMDLKTVKRCDYLSSLPSTCHWR